MRRARSCMHGLLYQQGGRPGQSWRAAGGGVASLVLALALWLLPAAIAGASLLAAPATSAGALPSDASCAQLAEADPSATNDAPWGTTILPGFGQPDGWFGTPVCGNGVNGVAPGGANLSCDRAPTNFAGDGCAPGAATRDGYGLSFQCVELVARFSAWAYGDAPAAWRGDAQYLWLAGHHPSDFTAYRDGGARAPQPGDILVWGTLDSRDQPWPAGPAGGHVAVVATVGGGHITFVEENMLGHRGALAINIPSETTTLSQSASGVWTVGPTYGTNGGRALYGWLHSTRDTGHFPTVNVAGAGGASDASAAAAASASESQTASQMASTASAGTGALPSLARDVVVTGTGALAELVWSDTHSSWRPAPPAPPAQAQALGGSTAQGAAAPYALVESLGAPVSSGGGGNAGLALDQTPAVVVAPTGERYIYVRGQDGQLYAAYTALDQPGAYWQPLGAPLGVALISSVTAYWDTGGVVVGALGSDGALWLRAGPAGMLGDWTSMGNPPAVRLQGTAVVTGAPVSSGASGASGAVTRMALAIGSDGTLYEADWRSQEAAAGASGSADGSQPPGWSDWTPVPLAGPTGLQPGSLVRPTPTAPASPNSSGVGGPAVLGQTGADFLLVSDAMGRVWLLRRGDMTAHWSADPLLTLPTSGVALSAAEVPSVIAAAGAPPTTLDIYAAYPRPGASVGSGAAASSAGTATPIPATGTATGVTATGVTATGVTATGVTATGSPAPQVSATPAATSGAAVDIAMTSVAVTATGVERAGAWQRLGTIPPAPTSGSTTPSTPEPMPSSTPSSTPEPMPSSTPSSTPEPMPSSTPSATPATPATPATVVGSSMALALGPGMSGLLLTHGARVTLLGKPAAIRAVGVSVPSGTTRKVGTTGTTGSARTVSGDGDIVAESGAATAAWTAVAPVEVFSDGFVGSDLDPRWLITGVDPGAAQMTAGGLRLSVVPAGAARTGNQPAAEAVTGDVAGAGTAGVTAALQGAPSGDFTVTTHVAPVGSWSPEGTSDASRLQAGILLRLDDWNTASLALRADGTVALCASAENAAGQCWLAAAPPGVSFMQGVYLRVSQSGTELIGQVSVDGLKWDSVGAWTPGWLPSANTSPGPYAPPLALTGTSGAAGADMSAGTSAATPAETVTSAGGATGAATGAVTSDVGAAGGWLTFSSLGLYVSGASGQRSSAQVGERPGALFSEFIVAGAGGLPLGNGRAIVGHE